MYYTKYKIGGYWYITNEDRPELGDYYIVKKTMEIFKKVHISAYYSDIYKDKKVFLSNDPKLHVQQLNKEQVRHLENGGSLSIIKVLLLKRIHYWVLIQNLQEEVVLEEIEKQVASIEERGEKIVKFLNKYKGQSIYNEIALAIEFGYQLRLEEEEEESVFEQPKKTIQEVDKKAWDDKWDELRDIIKGWFFLTTFRLKRKEKDTK